MIYLILTASLQTQILSTASEDRLARYHFAIQETLSCVPAWIQVILVENTGTGTGTGTGPFDNLSIPVIYTENGSIPMRNKGVNEWLDVKEVIHQLDMKDDDIVIKLTGRYRLLSPQFFEYIKQTTGEKDAWFRFMNVCTGEADPADCVLGCYAARVSALRYLSWSWMNLFDSPEKAMAKHIRSSVSTERIAEMDYLGVECIFSENGRVLCV